MKNQKPNKWSYIVLNIKSKEERAYNSHSAIFRNVGIPLSTLYYHFVKLNREFFLNERVLIKRVEG